MIRRVESEGEREGRQLPEGYSKCNRLINVQQLEHLCQLIRDTQ